MLGLGCGHAHHGGDRRQPARLLAPVGLQRRILLSALPVAAFTALLYLLDALKQILLAQWFGRGDEIEAFMIGSLLPVFLPSIVSAPVGLVLIPAYVEMKVRLGEAGRAHLVSGFLALQLTGLLALCLALLLFAGPIVTLTGIGFSEEKRAVARSVLLLLVPMVLLTSWAKTIGAGVNAERRFALVAFAPILVTAGGLVALWLWRDVFGIMALPAGMVAGALAMLLASALAAARAGTPWLPRRRHLDSPLRAALRSYLVLLCGTCLMTSMEFVDHAMAASLGPGSVAALNYGRSVVGVAVGVVSLALGAAVLPHVSHDLSLGRVAQVRRSFRVYTAYCLGGGLVAAALIGAFSAPIVRLLFERGAFGSADTEIVAGVQMLFALQVPWYVAGGVAVRILSALQMNQVILAVAGANLLLDIALNWLLMRYLGVAGIALATSCVYFVSFLVCWIHAERALRERADHGAH